MGKIDSQGGRCVLVWWYSWVWVVVEVIVVSLVFLGLEGYVLFFQIVFIDLLIFMGLRFDGIIGYFLGEVVCGYVDGCVFQEEVIFVVYWRGQCIKEVNISLGVMAVVGRGFFSFFQFILFTGLRLGAFFLAFLMFMLGRSRNVGLICWLLFLTRSDLDVLFGCLYFLWFFFVWRFCCLVLLLMDMSESQFSFYRNLS